MKYAIVVVSNGNYKIEAEGTDLNSMKVNFHNKAASLWNAPDVEEACVAIIDQNLDIVGGNGGYKEFISHVEPTPEPTPESTTEPSEV